MNGGLVFVNFVDFDMFCSEHRRDVPGYAEALEPLTPCCRAFINQMKGW